MRGTASYRGVSRRQSSSTGTFDNRLETKLMLLLSELEQLLVKIRDEKKGDKRAVLLLNTLCEVLNRIIGIAESVRVLDPDRISLIKVLESTNKIYPEARLLYGRKRNRLSVRSVVKLYEGWAEDPNDRPFIFRKIALAIVSLVEYYFAILKLTFKSTDVSVTWNEIYDVFLSDMRDLVSKVRF